jgi:hypothetical protein
MNYKMAKILALIIGIESFLVMGGWILRIDPLTRILPSGINMKFPTALVFFLSAWSLYFIAENIENTNKHARTLLLVISSSVFLTMSLLLIGVLFGIQTSIEKLFLLQESPIYTFGAGSPSILTMIDFILFGVVGILSSFQEEKHYSRLKFFGYLIAIIGLSPVLGYILNLSQLYYQFNTALVPMAFNTALCFVLLGLGLITLG